MRELTFLIRTAHLFPFSHFLQPSLQNLILLSLLTVSLLKILKILLQYLIFPAQFLILSYKLLRSPLVMFIWRGVNLASEAIVERSDGLVLGRAALGLMETGRSTGTVEQAVHCLKLLYVYAQRCMRWLPAQYMIEANEKDIRTQMLEALSKYNIKQVDVAREAGIHHSTLSLWLQGKVKGHHIKIQDTLAEWLDSLYSGRPRYTTLNKTVDKQFVLTPAAANITRKHAGVSDQTLIPIHFDLELQGKRYKQQFCWNINDPYFTPEEFAHLVVTENPTLAHFEGHIRDTIRKAISSHRPYKPPQSSCLRTLQLDVKIDNICLKDRFDWDITDETASPEDFALQLVKELNLNNEFMVKIAHQIREQLEYYRKNYGSMTAVKQEDSALLDIKKSTRNLISFNDSLQEETIIMPSNFLRRNNEEWEPKIEILDAGEIRKFQKLEERQNRYARRAR